MLYSEAYRPWAKAVFPRLLVKSYTSGTRISVFSRTPEWQAQKFKGMIGASLKGAPAHFYRCRF
jgi:hypothetical protein